MPLVSQLTTYEIDLDTQHAKQWAPKSVAMLASRPEIVAAGLSVMMPGTRILSHVDLRTEGIIRAHLGIEIPPESGIRVGPNLERWEEGKVIVFDGRIDHETANLGSTPRVVVLVDFWMSEAEQAYLDETNVNVDSRWLKSGAGAGLFSGADM